MRVLRKAASYSGATVKVNADSQSPSDYAQTKAMGEAAVRAAFPAATILRPSIIFGPEDSFFNRFAAMTRFSPAHSIADEVGTSANANSNGDADS